MVGRLFNRPGQPKHEFPAQLAADSPRGHYLWPFQRVQLTRLEPQPPLADHYSRLFFGRTSTVQVQVGQPFFIWQPAPRIDDPEAVAWRATHDLNRFRTTFQTVGQPWSLWPKYQQPSFDPEVIRSPEYALNIYRTGFQTVGQPYALVWNKPPGPWFDVEVIKQPDHSALNLYRVGFQTVGQPWGTWPPYQQPYFEPEKIVGPQYDLSPYRQITITAGPGQPWYCWPPIQITIQPEEQMYRENHDLSLYPFRPHDAFTPVPDVPSPIGDGGRSPHKGFNLAAWKKKQKPLRDLEDDIEALYKEITSPSLVEKAERIVKPFVPPKLRAETIKASTVEWDRVVQNIRAIEKLHALYEQEISDDDDDIEEMIGLL